MTQPYFTGPVGPIHSAASAVDLRTRVSNLFEDGFVARVVNVNTFEWDSASIKLDNGTTIIIPDDITHPAPGRWVKIGPDVLTSQVFS